LLSYAIVILASSHKCKVKTLAVLIIGKRPGNSEFLAIQNLLVQLDLCLLSSLRNLVSFTLVKLFVINFGLPILVVEGNI